MKVTASNSINFSLLFCKDGKSKHQSGLSYLIETYIVLVPHDVQESVEGQVEVGSTETGESSEDAACKEHSVQMLLGVGEESLDLLSGIGCL